MKRRIKNGPKLHPRKDEVVTQYIKRVPPTNLPKFVKKHKDLRRAGVIKKREIIPPHMRTRILNRMKFIEKIKKQFPALFRRALKNLPVKSREVLLNKGVLNGLGSFADSFGDIFSSFTDTIKNIAPQYLQIKQQKKLMDMQLKRAEAGLPPANVDDYTPVIRTQIETGPETRQVIRETAESGFKSLALPIGLGVGGLLLVMLMKKRR